MSPTTSQSSRVQEQTLDDVTMKLEGEKQPKAETKADTMTVSIYGGPDLQPGPPQKAEPVPRSQRRGLGSQFTLIPEVTNPYEYSNGTKWAMTIIVAFAAATSSTGTSSKSFHKPASPISGYMLRPYRSLSSFFMTSKLHRTIDG